MSETNVATPPVEQEQQVAAPDVNAQLAANLWNETPMQQPAQEQQPPAEQQTAQQPAEQQPPASNENIIDANEYLKEQLGFESWDTAKAEIEKWRQAQQQPPVVAKDFSEIIKDKEEELYNYYTQKRQIGRLEKLPIANTNEATEIIKASLLFKNKNLTQDDVDFLVQETYSKPAKPVQYADEEDAVYSTRVSEWEQQVQRIDRKMIIDAKQAQPELVNYKSQISLPDIPKVANEAPQPDQKVLEAQQAFQANFMQKLESDYKNFNGYATKAIDGGVELPINYAVTPEELNASKQQLANLNVNEFLDSRWFDEKGTPNIKQMQEDLYLLQNRDKIFQKIANEASAQRLAHHLKTKSNVNVNGATTPPVQSNGKSVEQEFAEKIWGL